MLRKLCVLAAAGALVGGATQFAFADGTTPSSVTITNFNGFSSGCAGGNILPVKNSVAIPIPLLPNSNCTAVLGQLGLESATATYSADDAGALSVGASAVNGNQVIGEQAYSYAAVNGNTYLPSPTSSIDITAQFSTDALSATDMVPAPVQDPLYYPYIPNDSSFVSGGIQGFGPDCVDGSRSASTNSIWIDPRYPAGSYTFRTKIYCPDGAKVDSGGVNVSADLSAAADSNNASTQRASGSMRLLNATFTFNP